MSFCNSFSWLMLASLLTLTTACSTQSEVKPEAAADSVKQVSEPVKPLPVTPPPPSKAQQELAAGISSYEDGNYRQAIRQLQYALTLGLDVPADEARAHKYLAFMHCVGKRQTQCRDEFRKALVADPAFILTPGEAGHPIWGAVFRKIKADPKAGSK